MENNQIVPIQVSYSNKYQEFSTDPNSPFPKLIIDQKGFRTSIFRVLPKRLRTPPKKRLTLPTTSMIDRANEFKKLMEQNHWSRAELARQLNVSRAWITRVMRSISES